MIQNMKTGLDDIILFDGVCNLCSASVRFIIRHDKREVFRFVSIQSELGRELLTNAGLDADDVPSFVVMTAKQTLTHSDAAIEIARRLGGMLRVLVLLRYLPKRWRDGCYSFVAGHRFAWFGRSDQGMIPSDNGAKRFLE